MTVDKRATGKHGKGFFVPIKLFVAPSQPNFKQQAQYPSQGSEAAQFARKWPILNDVTGPVLTAERTEMNIKKMEKNKYIEAN